MGRKYLPKELYPKCIKTSNFNNKKKKIFKWAKAVTRHSTKEDTQMANKYMKRCSTSYVIRELQIKRMRYHYTIIRMAKTQNTDNIKC